MKKIGASILYLLAILIGYRSFAGQEIDTTKSLLWRITGNGLQQPSYLFGTIHLICQDDYLWTTEMSHCFQQCDVVCLEMDLGDSTLLKAARTGAKDKNEPKLESYFTPGEYKSVHQYFLDKGNIDIEKHGNLKLTALIAIAFKIKLGCSKVASYELNFVHAAAKQGKRTAGLETLQEQLDAVGTIPKDRLVKVLVAEANGNTEAKEFLQKMVATYKDQDQAMAHKVIAEVGGELMNDMLVDERNEKWIPRMKTKMEQAPVFFAVGAGHLGGEKGVIHLLKKTGYTVEPVISKRNDTNTDKMPSPDFDLPQYLSANLHYPKKARKQHIEGKVLIKFSVNTDGTISDCIVKSGIGGGCDKEALRVVKNMPRWKPAVQGGKAVKVWYTLPVNFRLR